MGENVNGFSSCSGVSSSSGRENEDLYIMRNSMGFIKVGRSVDPERRRRDLELTSGASVKLVAVFPSMGIHELAFHRSLMSHRSQGEWFSPTQGFYIILMRAIAPLIMPGMDAEKLSAKKLPGLSRPRMHRRPKSEKTLLDDSIVKSAIPRARGYKLNDGNGLHLYIAPTGSKTWRLRYQVKGREILLTIGHYPIMTLLSARLERDERIESAVTT